MTTTATITGTVTFPLTREGFDAARDLIDAHEAELVNESAIKPATPRGPSVEPAPAGGMIDDGDVPRAVYEAAWEDGLSRPYLKALPAEDEGGLTMAEIGEQLKAYWADDRPLTPAETRAVHRNVKKIERTLKRRGQMPEDRVVVRKDWSDSEGVGRYYVSAADHEAIAAL